MSQFTQITVDLETGSTDQKTRLFNESDVKESLEEFSEELSKKYHSVEKQSENVFICILRETIVIPGYIYNQTRLVEKKYVECLIAATSQLNEIEKCEQNTEVTTDIHLYDIPGCGCIQEAIRRELEKFSVTSDDIDDLTGMKLQKISRLVYVYIPLKDRVWWNGNARQYLLIDVKTLKVYRRDKTSQDKETTGMLGTLPAEMMDILGDLPTIINRPDYRIDVCIDVSGDHWKLPLKNGVTILDVKKNLERTLNIGISDQQLLYDGNVLEDSLKVTQCVLPLELQTIAEN